MDNKNVNWDKIKEEKNFNIILGRSQNQAIELLLKVQPFSFDIEAKYKEFTRKLFKWNCELQEELLNFGEALGDPVTEEVIQDSEIKLSDKQKLCPKCNKAMPKSWKRHDVCGWRG